LVVEDEKGNARPVIWWRGAAESSPPGRFDLAYTVRASDFRGQRELLIEWVDAHPVAEAGEGETGAPTIETIDYRTESNPLPTLRQLRSQHPNLLIWAEASAHLEDAQSRYDLQSARTLVVWTAPPGPDEWQAALDQVAPTRVYLFGRDPGLDRVEPFLKRLAGLVKYALNHRDGFVSIPDLAAETAQREQTVRAGVEWLRARGQVSLIEQDEQVIRLAAGGEEDPHTLEKMTDQLQALLKETAAYRAYWHKMSTG
jgi:hypothetical protein